MAWFRSSSRIRLVFWRAWEDGCGRNPTPSFTRGIRVRSKQEVILTKPLAGLGKAGQIVKVAPGYARNKLIPELIALPAIEKYVILVKKQLEAVQRSEEKPDDVVKEEIKPKEDKLKDVSVILKRLDSGRVVIRKELGKTNSLQFSINKDEVVAEVQRQLGVLVQPANLEMDVPISTLGEFEIPLRFSENLALPDGKVKLYLRIKVRRK